MRVSVVQQLFLAACLGCVLLARPSAGEDIDVWIGTTTPRNGQSKGIYLAALNSESGKLTTPKLVAEIQNPGFLATHPKAGWLYSTGSIEGEAVVAAFAIEGDGAGKSLRLMNSKPIPGGAGATHLTVDRSGRFLFTAQYGGGSVAMFELSDDGTIQRSVKTVQHAGGSGVVQGRQDKPHPHWVGLDPTNRFVLVPDLGLDRVVIYRLDADAPTIVRHGSAKVPPGGGPRHMKFHTSGKFAFVLNELALSVSTFAYDADKGTMTLIQTIATVPEELKAKEPFVSASEIRVHPSGRFVYAANRGHDTITAFTVNEESGELTFVEREPIRGGWPRNFNIDPTGRWLLAAGRDSNTIAVFGIDQETGELAYARNLVSVPTPICVLLPAR